MSIHCSAPLVNGTISLVGVAVGGVVGFFSARLVSDRNARSAAAAKFRAAFAPAIAIFAAAEMQHRSQADRVNISQVLKESFVAHAAAIEEFRSYVPQARRAAFEAAWASYCELEPTRWDGSVEALAEEMAPDAPKEFVLGRLRSVFVFGEA